MSSAFQIGVDNIGEPVQVDARGQAVLLPFTYILQLNPLYEARRIKYREQVVTWPQG